MDKTLYSFIYVLRILLNHQNLNVEKNCFFFDKIPNNSLWNPTILIEPHGCYTN